MLTAERLREVLDYDAETGLFTRKEPRNRWKAGQVAGGETCHGYTGIKIDNRVYLAHRLAWLYVFGEWPSKGLDHLNGSRRDNRLVNLREATHAENAQNRRGARRGSAVDFIGVSRYRGVFRAQIKTDGKNKHIGYFGTPEAAHEAYLDAKRKLHSHNTL